ncbi:AAA family ATPase [Paraburkholderia sp. GAS334]|jgi:pilus assembly protein CpaE|uniref:AAA family ATPase n=1 Tax=unclassified Paraburkholderia TaxID=2615204 RepID=UPI003D190F2A
MIDILLIASNEEHARDVTALLATSEVRHRLRTERGAAKQLPRYAEQIKKTDLLIVADTALAISDLAAIGEAIGHAPQLSCMLVASALSTEMLMAAMRAGVRHVLSWPIDAQEFAQELSHVAGKKTSSTRRDGRVMSFTSGRGGSGTTLIAANLAYAFAAARDKRVLLVDLNQQFSDASLLVTEKKPPATIADLFAQIERLDAAYFDACVSHVHSNLDVLAGAGDPVKAADMRASHLERVLTLVRDQYDAVIFDIGQTINPLALHALDQSEAICVVAQQTIPHLHAGRKLLDMLGALGYSTSKMHLLVNQYEKGAQVDLAAIEEALGVKPVHLLPRDEKSARQAVNQGVPLLESAKGSSLTKSLGALAGLLWPQPAAPSRRVFGRFLAPKQNSLQQLKPVIDR